MMVAKGLNKSLRENVAITLGRVAAFVSAREIAARFRDIAMPLLEQARTCSNHINHDCSFCLLSAYVYEGGH